MQSAAELDLHPIPGKTYRNFTRRWSEEFIYFMLVDRFHDDRVRTSATGPGRSVGGGTEDQLGEFCGGTLKGIEAHLDYIAGLGCTALWLSPVFGNNPHSYHGYAIQNYLEVDAHFGTLQDLVDLVDAAHARDMRVVLDVVLNHSGDNWSYAGKEEPVYDHDRQFPFGSFRPGREPVPTELRNPAVYHRRGQIRNWDAYPEYERGDFYGLKDYNNDIEDPNDEAARGLMNTLIRAHCFWLREADIDGFRVDAVKHMGTAAIARFSSELREYALSLGKRSFFLFGELIGGDDALNRYIGPNTPADKEGTVFFGLDSVLDYPLYFALPEVLKGRSGPGALYARHEAQRQRALSHGQLGQFLVTFLDNHDGVGFDPKRRYAADCNDLVVIASVGYLLCALGTPCIYYGTEQGFAGHGESDVLIRETMFDLARADRNFLNPECTIYQQVARIAAVCRDRHALRFGRMYFREISGNGQDFGLPQGAGSTLAWARILANDELLIAYNTSSEETHHDYVLVDDDLRKAGDTLHFLYGGSGSVAVQTYGHLCFVQLDLAPNQFVILQ
jgi:glycosidase